jgi:tyrosinase
MTRFSLAGLATVLLAGAVSAQDPVLALQNQGRPQIDAAIAKSATCTKDKLQVRREWYVEVFESRRLLDSYG